MAETHEITLANGKPLTTKHLHQRLAEELLKPNCESVTQAMLRAGYSKATAEKQQSRAVERVGVQKALTRARKRDNAKGNLSTALGKIGDQLSQPQDLPTLNQTAVAMSRVVSEQPEDEQPVEHTGLWAAATQRRTWLLMQHCLKLGMDKPDRAARMLEWLSRKLG